MSMKKQLKRGMLFGLFSISFLIPSVWVQSQSVQNDTPIPIIQRHPTASQKPEHPPQLLSLNLPNQKVRNDSNNFSEHLTQLVVSPFAGHQEIIDAIRAMSRYYTGGGSHQIGIKVDI